MSTPNKDSAPSLEDFNRAIEKINKAKKEQDLLTKEDSPKKEIPTEQSSDSSSTYNPHVIYEDNQDVFKDAFDNK